MGTAIYHGICQRSLCNTGSNGCLLYTSNAQRKRDCEFQEGKSKQNLRRSDFSALSADSMEKCLHELLLVDDEFKFQPQFFSGLAAHDHAVEEYFKVIGYGAVVGVNCQF